MYISYILYPRVYSVYCSFHQLQDTLKRYEEKVEELEVANTELYKHVHTDTRRSVVIDQEASSLRERLQLLEQQCDELKWVYTTVYMNDIVFVFRQDRQKMEERLMQC